MTTETFEAFKARKLAEGHDEVLVREWAPSLFNDQHDHPFDTDAIVVKGEFWLTLDGKTTHYRIGDTFRVGRGIRHAEKFGPDGAVFWAARKN